MTAPGASANPAAAAVALRIGEVPDAHVRARLFEVAAAQ
jgi:hypothetical protein